MKSARFLWLAVAGCALGHPGREQLGDEAWHAARWSDAVADYTAAGDAPRVTAKLADAEFQAGLLAESAQAWVRLARDDPGRVGEAAAGLARVAHRAEDDGKQAALVQAILGLRQIAPRWPLGRMAAWMTQAGDLTPAVAVDVIPALLAAAPEPGSAEPLLLALGRADQAQGACDAAVPVLEGVVRRSGVVELHDSASVALSTCDLKLGMTALGANRAGDAERWFDRAAATDSSGSVGRRARLGLGDARLRQGDTAAARAAWAQVAAGATLDSLTQLALVRLQQVSTPPPDSARPSAVRP